MDIDTVVHHQASVDIKIFPGRAKPSPDDFGSLQGVLFLVKRQPAFGEKPGPRLSVLGLMEGKTLLLSFSGIR